MIVAFLTNDFFKKPSVKREACDGALSLNIIFLNDKLFFFFQGSRNYLKNAVYVSSVIFTPSLGTGHKVSARVGRSDLGWAMENILVVWMGHQFFLEYLVGSPNKIQSFKFVC